MGGSPGKSVRIIGTKKQIDDNVHGNVFKPSALDELAKAHGMTAVHQNIKGQVRDEHTTGVQHSKIMKAGAVQVDILILQFDKSHNAVRDHQPLRDRVLDDAMLSIGQGEAGSEDFGRHRLDPQAAAKDKGDVAHVALPEHVPQHEEGDQRKPEKPKAPSTRDKPVQAAGHEVYQKGGRLSAEHLTQRTLSDGEFAFKQTVYEACTARLGDHVYGGVPPEMLTGTENGQKIRKDVAGPVSELLSAIRADIAAHKPARRIPVGGVTGVTIQSGYRSPEKDMALWDGYFQKYLAATKAERVKTGDEFGHRAVKIMVSYVGLRKAPPEGSNHSNGIAIDLQMQINGKASANDYNNQKKWRSSWLYQWLKENAARYGFKNYEKEAWHWDYRGGGT